MATGYLAATCPHATAQDGPVRQDDAPGIARTVSEHGPLEVTIEVSPQPARLSDLLTLAITVRHGPHVELTPPALRDSFPSFSVDSASTELLSDNAKVVGLRQTYVLEPTDIGQLTIPAVAITYRDTSLASGFTDEIVTTEPLVVEVTTTVDPQSISLADLRPSAEPIAAPRAARRWPWVVGVATSFSLLSSVIGWYLYRRMRRSPVLTPRDRAYRALERLGASQAVSTDVKAFYAELTGIVRQYIEDATTVRAPELTTEEFLAKIARHEQFSNVERDRLREFLESADLVKFAGFKPSSADIDHSVERARVFIGTIDIADPAVGSEATS
ncbi:MAG: hypothetical protein KDA60_04255 [Planctomycetales bacterium]|nr:hypothetical protein [Planctomycetales bacterium]